VDALRLLMLYALRYEKSRSAGVVELRRFVGDRFDMRGSLALVDALVAYAGANARSCDLFGANASVFSKLAGTVSRGMAGVQNVYTQHQVRACACVCPPLPMLSRSPNSPRSRC